MNVRTHLTVTVLIAYRNIITNILYERIFKRIKEHKNGND